MAANEPIIIPVEIDPSRGLSALADFGARAKKSIAGIAPGGVGSNGEIRLRMNLDPSQAVGGLKRVGEAAEQASKKLNLVPNSSNQATQSLANLGRVVQDAPFGFIGVANNINPLLESFQRLRASTGTTGGAFKALGASLMGAGGIGIAVSVVSSLLVVFGDKLFGSSKKVKEAAEEIKRAQELLKSLAGTADERAAVGGASAADEIAKVKVLSGVIMDQVKSYKERNAALEQLKDINKNYFGDLSLEENSLKTLTGRVEEYSRALIAAAVVKEFSSDIAKLSVESAKQINVYNRLGNELDVLKRKLASTPKNTFVLQRGDMVEAPNKEYQKLEKQINATSAALTKQGNVISELSTSSMVSLNGLNEAITESLKFKPLGGGGGGESVENEMNKIIARAKALASEFPNLIPAPYFSELDTLSEKFQKARKYLQEFQQGMANGFARDGTKISIQPGVLLDWQEVMNPPIQELKPVSEEVKMKLTTLFKDFRLPVKLKFDADPAKTKQLEEIEKQIQEIVKNFGATLFSSVGESLGDALSGKTSGIEAMISVIGDLIQQLGKALIQYGIVKTGLDKILAGGLAIPGGFAIALGVAAVAAGAAFKNIKQRRFALGGIVSGPTNAEIGEGPYTSRNNPEVVAPLDKLKNFFASMMPGSRNYAGVSNMGMGGMNLSIPSAVRIYASGRDLVGVMAIENKSQGRNF